MIDILGIGELLIDFTPIPTEGLPIFQQNPGGAPCNMLAMAQAMGVQTAFVGKVGNDQFGLHLKGTLEKHGIDCRGLIMADDFHTTLAFVHLKPGGERRFSFYRKGCADVNLTKEEIDHTLIDESRVVHFGSLSFTDEPSRSAVLEAIQYAKSQGKLITYDPNYRPVLWPSVEAAIEGMRLGLPLADIIKVSDEEALLLTEESSIANAASSLMTYGIRLICITMGAEGVYFKHKGGEGIVKGYEADVKDTTGAGDAFFGALIAQLLHLNIDNITIAALEKMLDQANAAASLVVENYGGMPSIPTRIAVHKRYESSF